MPRHLASKLESIRSFERFCAGLELPRNPLEIFLEISNVCDLRCAMCTEFSALNSMRYAALKRYERGFLKMEDVAHAMRGALEGALLVHCSGYGEPTINPEFRDFISVVSEFEVLIDFITNGVHLDDSLAEFLVERNVFRVGVSLSGSSRDDYESVYLRGNFDRVLNGVRALANAKARAGREYPQIGIYSLGFEHHVRQFDAFVELVGAAGANIVYLKKLQPYPEIPELYEHVSVMRPWVEGKIIDRAVEIGRRMGVIVLCDQYIADGVGSEAEYEARVAELRSQGDGRLSRRKFGDNPTSAFATIARDVEVANGGDGREKERIVPLGATDEEARRELDIGPLPGLSEAPFYCLEPYKTLYVRQNGAVKPCCFGADHPWLGSIRTDDALSVWRGAGYRAIRTGIFENQYPRPYCGRCLRDRIGPPDHFAFELLGTFLAWYSRCHTETLEREIEERMPTIFGRLRRSKGEQIAESHRARNRREFGEASAIDRESAGLPTVEGWLDRVTDGRAEGWAWWPNRPLDRLRVAIYHGSERIAEGVAWRPRDDLVSAGKGDGCYGFSVALPATETDWQKSDLRAAVLADEGEVALGG